MTFFNHLALLAGLWFFNATTAVAAAATAIIRPLRYFLVLAMLAVLVRANFGLTPARGVALMLAVFIVMRARMAGTWENTLCLTVWFGISRLVANAFSSKA